MMKKTPFATLKKVIAKAKNITIVTHINPDGDAMGSSLGMYQFLKNKGKNVKVVVPNMFPDFLAWLPNTARVAVFEGNETAVQKQITKSDVVFILDFNNYKRIEKLGEMIQKSASEKF